MNSIVLKEDYIKLGQALKACGLVSSGIEAKIEITSGNVKVNGEVDERRGRKLYPGDIVEFNEEKIEILGKDNDN
ncbi:ribosome-associated protein [Lachnospiraceae bacterium RM5]|nr:ribosome-associated protein [Lachnospiraceae bacterium RM5]